MASLSIGQAVGEGGKTVEEKKLEKQKPEK